MTEYFWSVKQGHLNSGSGEASEEITSKVRLKACHQLREF